MSLDEEYAFYRYYICILICCLLLLFLEGFKWYPDHRKPSTQPQEPSHSLSCSLVTKPPNMRQTELQYINSHLHTLLYLSSLI